MAPLAPLAFLAFLSLCRAVHHVELHNTTWSLKNGNGSINVRVANASNTHMNLMEAGILKGDPYYRYNELLWSWAANETWTYSTEFSSTAAMLSYSKQVLRCQVDTVSIVMLNGKEVGNTTNMFIEYEFDVTDHLAPVGGLNKLEVRILSALRYAAEKAKEYPYFVPASVYYHDWVEGPNPDLSGTGEGTSVMRNFVRKVPSDFGWDWGPAFVPSGITRLSLVSQSTASLTGLTVRQQHSSDGSVSLTVEAHLQVVADCAVSLKATLRPPDGGKPLIQNLYISHLGAGLHKAAVEIEVADAQLWWPVGFGQQLLYGLELQLSASNTAGHSDTSVLQKRVGLRRAELIEEPMPGGRSFFFRVNGVDVYAKGSNFIPPDVFAPRAASEFEWILRSAVDANMNMVRVWGGGLYQADEFYDLADKLGILIWQEMVFACALYPRDKEFLSSVATEIKQQALRLQHHASIVVWGGNNENEQALGGTYASQHRDRYVVDYTELYIDTARPALRSIDPDVAFIDSSPSNGVISTEPYVKRWGDVQDLHFGDVHYYNYAADCEDASTYPHARFVSEHGFQSFPSFITYQHVLDKEDWHPNSSQLFWRQRHPQGQEQMEAMLQRHFRLPHDFDNYLYLTQVQQSRCYETAFGVWRRLRSDKTVGTMGILYWQLNDIWPGPSWSSMEHSGTWRLTHSAVQRSFEPVLASLLVVNARVQAFVTSDLTAPITAELHAKLWHVKGNSTYDWFSCKVTGLQAGTELCQGAALGEALQAAGCTNQTCFAYVEGTTNETQARLLTAHTFLAPLKDVNLPEAHVKVTQPVKVGDKRASVQVKSDSVAVFTALESEVPGRFAPNAMLLLPSQQVTVEFLGRDDFEINNWAKKLRVRSLSDTYPMAEFTHLV